MGTRSAKIQFVSSGVIANQNGQFGFNKAWSETRAVTRLKSNKNREDNFHGFRHYSNCLNQYTTLGT
jgi:hypothetical protein